MWVNQSAVDVPYMDPVYLQGIECNVCGSIEVRWTCPACNNQLLCDDCDKRWHLHFLRRDHKRLEYRGRELAAASGQQSAGDMTSPSQKPDIR